MSTYESKAIKIENLFSSVASGTDLGTFTGSTLSDNASVKTALQELETALETEASDRATAIYDCSQQPGGFCTWHA